MDSKVFWLVMLVGFAMVVFIVFLTNNPVWQEAHRVNLEALRTASDDARDDRAAPRVNPVALPSVVVSQPSPPAVANPRPEPQANPTPATSTAAAQAPAQPTNEPAQVVSVSASTPAKPVAEKPSTIIDLPGERYSPIDVFFRDYEAALEDINDESEPDQQERICRDATQRIDEVLRGQTWEFNCMISKLETLPDHLFNISHQAPDEVDLLPDGWTVLDRAASIPLLQLANKQQIFKGDYIVYVGTPRFDTVLADSDAVERRGEYTNLTAAKKVRPLTATQIPDAKYFYCTIEIGGVPYNQSLHLTNVNVKFLKGADNVARTQWQEQMQKQAKQGMPRVPQQLSLPQQQTLAQMAPNAAVPNSMYPATAAPGGTEVVYQTNNYYSSSHPYYLYPEWLTFYHDHHFHHAHEHEVDFARLSTPANSTAAATAKVQAAVKQAPVRQPTVGQSFSPPVKSPVKPPTAVPLKQAQAK